MKAVKWLVVAMAIAGLCATASAARMEQGTQELNIEGSAQDLDELEYNVSVGYGYFVAKDAMIGGLVGYEAEGDAWALTLGAKAEYNFDMVSVMVPFVGIGIRWGYADDGNGNNDDTYVITPNAGVKYFVTDNLSVGLRVQYHKADIERYKYEDEWKDTKTTLELDTRFYF